MGFNGMESHQNIWKDAPEYWVLDGLFGKQLSELADESEDVSSGCGLG